MLGAGLLGLVALFMLDRLPRPLLDLRVIAPLQSCHAEAAVCLQSKRGAASFSTVRRAYNNDALDGCNFVHRFSLGRRLGCFRNQISPDRSVMRIKRLEINRGVQRR
jgi:hypothetical protein